MFVFATNSHGTGGQVSNAVGPVVGGTTPPPPPKPSGVSLNKSSVKAGKTVKLTLTLAQGGTVTVKIKNKHGKVKKTEKFTEGSGNSYPQDQDQGPEEGQVQAGHHRAQCQRHLEVGDGQPQADLVVTKPAKESQWGGAQAPPHWC